MRIINPPLRNPLCRSPATKRSPRTIVSRVRRIRPEQPERSYTWWDYRTLAFRRKMGLRIDHILLSEELARRCTACTIDIEPRKNERPSDHAPVIAELRLD